jgi:sulfotransferase 6B1
VSIPSDQLRARSAPDQRALPRVVQLSVPKSGTNVLRKTAELMGFRRLRSLSHRNLVEMAGYEDFAPAPVAQVDVNTDRPVRLEAVVRRLDAMKPGELLFGHVAYSEDLHAYLRSRGFKVMVMLRDPRDVAVSLAQTLAEGPGRHPGWKRSFAAMSLEEQLRRSILGGAVQRGPVLWSLRRRFEAILPWRHDPDVLEVRFEQLIGPRGGGDLDVQAAELRRIADFLAVPLSDDGQKAIGEELFGGTATFRKGALGAWRELFAPEHVGLCKAEVGDILIELGYESDDSWDRGAPEPSRPS